MSSRHSEKDEIVPPGPKAGRAAFVVAVLAVVAATAGAEDIEDEALSLRLPAALTRFAPYGDVAGVGGASAGSKWSSSTNPAAVAWDPELRFSVTPQYSNVRFDQDLDLDVWAEATVFDLTETDRLQPAIAQVRSEEATTRQGLDYRLDIDLVQVQWARRIDEDWAVGANFNFSKAHADYDLGPLAVSDSESETYGWRFGVTHRLCDDPDAGTLLGGVVFDYAFTKSRTTLYDFMGTGVGRQRIEDTGHQFALRPGVAWYYEKDSAVYADYQYGSFHDDTGRLQVHRFMVGVDHKIVEGVFGRAGVTLDQAGNTAWAVGIGFYPSEWLGIDVAYQDNMFPELEPEFGESRTLTFSLSFSF
jgi:hypothetical protein